MGKGKGKEVKFKPFLIETLGLKATGTLCLDAMAIDFEDGTSKPLAELFSRFDGDNVVISVSLKNDLSGTASDE